MAVSAGIRQRAEQLAALLPPLLVEAERIAVTVAQGVHGRRRVGTGDAFWQFRRYQPGDPAQAIDWRQSAKRQSYFIRQNEWEAAESVWLWRDDSPSMAWRSNFGPCEKLERATLLLLATAALLVRAFKESGYISFLTVGGKENRAWPIRAGLTAWEAAGTIHTDIQKGFIRAEIISLADFVEAGGETQAKRAGKQRLELKTYVMQDYDVVNFRFNK